MHFLLMLVRLILDWLMPEWRDGLKMVVRNDGRVEQMPTRPNRWSWWVSLLEEVAASSSRKPKTSRAANGRARPKSSAANSFLRN